ncbi:hypothetical protein SLS62_007707 [Diatrype stigma]|uniref:Major facilitator superfamily (MFS) profile domain-containing protein n=1 Tax=Diatrype stigma TaxID=117547 RepID=A0AAN9YM46_9PEZI
MPSKNNGGMSGAATDPAEDKTPAVSKRGFRFWAIIVGLCIANLQASLENSVVVTSGPTIVADLHMGAEYIWITNAFFVAAVQPLYGQLCNIFGRRWLMLFAIALFTLGSGICGGATSSAMLIAGRGIQGAGSGGIGMIWEGSTTAEWATYQSIGALGAGVVLETLLPAFQAPVPESDQAAATATWAFIRTVGGVWGVAIPATIFNNRVDQLVYTISDLQARQWLAGGGAYQHASATFVTSFPEPVVSEIRAVYREALKLVFLTAVAFGGVAFLLFFLEKDVPLRKQLETEYGLVDSSKSKPVLATNVDVEKNRKCPS